MKKLKRPKEFAYAEKVLLDLVCGMEFTNETDFIFIYKGKEYHFCSEHCKIHFVDDPQKYVGV